MLAKCLRTILDAWGVYYPKTKFHDGHETFHYEIYHEGWRFVNTNKNKTIRQIPLDSKSRSLVSHLFKMGCMHEPVNFERFMIQTWESKSLKNRSQLRWWIIITLKILFRCINYLYHEWWKSKDLEMKMQEGFTPSVYWKRVGQGHWWKITSSDGAPVCNIVTDILNSWGNIIENHISTFVACDIEK